MPELTPHERYLRGDALTPELEAMRDGREPVAEQKPAAARNVADPLERDLTRAERLDLKEWMEMPGWELFLRLMEKANGLHQKRAITYSQIDPLSNQAAIANSWAYASMFRKATAEMVEAVKTQVQELEKSE